MRTLTGDGKAIAMKLTKDEAQPVFESACHEGNYGLTGILSAARAEEKQPPCPRLLS